MTWSLSLPDKKNETSLLIWADALIKQGVPRQIICNFLLHDKDLISLENRLNVESQLSKVMLDRNINSRNFERAGLVDSAIKLYELNVIDWFGGNFPYERLKIIYSKQKQYDECIRVCKAFVNVVDYYLSDGSLRGDLIPKRNKFIKWISELEEMKYGKSRSSI